MVNDVMAAAGAGSLDLPDGWSVLDEPLIIEGGPAPAAAAVEDDPGEFGFSANLTVVVTAADGLSFEQWQQGVDERVPDYLTEYLLLDEERLEVGGRAGVRRLAHYRSDDGYPVTVEQWLTAVDDRFVTLTFSVDTPRYHELADAFGDCVDSWMPDRTEAS